MHIVIAAWIYVVAMVSLVMKGAIAAAATFILMGVLPVALYAWFALRRVRMRRSASATPAAGAGGPAAAAPTSGLEREVHAGDDRDA